MAGVGAITAYVQKFTYTTLDVPWMEWSMAGLKTLSILLCASAACAYVYVSGEVARPIQLHANGLALLIMLAELVALAWGGFFFWEETPLAAWSLFVVGNLCIGSRKAIFVAVATGRMCALGSRAPLCFRIRPWGYGLIVCVLSLALSAVTGNAVLFLLALAGHSQDEALDVYLSYRASLPGIILRGSLILGAVSAMGVAVTSLGFLLSAWRLTRGVVRKLVERDPESEQLTVARRTLWQHFFGVLVSLSTTNLSFVTRSFSIFNFVGNALIEEFVGVTGAVIDEIGDIIGILLLSGIGVLLLNKGAEAGDVSSHISGVLHSAVLTSRAATVFEGHVAKTPGNVCVASFPGKYWEAWSSLTWKCERGELSSACVFLPTADPQGRFGRHSENPEDPDRCWCASLYGEVKPWGCQWFVEWKSNVEKAAKLGLDLVVVFFPKQAGKGKVAWQDLPTADLWDGEGLGGSQKGEVAYLMRQGLPMVEEDVDTFRRRLGL